MYVVVAFFCLFVFWVTAILVAGAAWQDWGDLRMLGKGLRTVHEGTILTGLGEGGVFAKHITHQVGRALDAEKAAIVFHDRGYESALLGGTIRVNEDVVHVSHLPVAKTDIWIANSRQEPTVEPFQSAYLAAKKAKGFSRDVTTHLNPGDRVYIAGKIHVENGLMVTRDVTLVAAFDPREWISQRCQRIATFIALELLIAAACTIVVLWPPVFGTVSTLGGMLCLAYFLGVTPWAVAVRDACRVPSRSILRGRWDAPRGAVNGATLMTS